MRRALSITAVFGAVMSVVVACGSTSPLDESVVGTPATPDAGIDATIQIAPTDAAAPVADATVEAGPLQCAGCVVGTCGEQILSCLGDKDCLGVLECVTTTCLTTAGATGDGGKSAAGTGSGGLDASCLLGCLTKNPQGAVSVLGIFTCVTGTCGSDCGSTLGGLGSIGGLGGLGGLGGFGKAPIDQSQIGPIDEAAFREVFTPIVQH